MSISNLLVPNNYGLHGGAFTTPGKISCSTLISTNLEHNGTTISIRSINDSLKKIDFVEKRLNISNTKIDELYIQHNKIKKDLSAL